MLYQKAKFNTVIDFGNAALENKEVNVRRELGFSRKDPWILIYSHEMVKSSNW